MSKKKASKKGGRSGPISIPLPFGKIVDALLATKPKHRAGSKAKKNGGVK